MMVQSDLYMHGPQAQRDAIVQMVMAIAKKIGVDTTRKSDLNIPMGHEYFHDHAVLKSLEQSQ